MKAKHVVALLDGMNIIRRVHEASPAPDDEAKAEATWNSSLRSMLRAVTETGATITHCVLDEPGETWRHRLYPAYQANRKPMSAHLAAVLPSLRSDLTRLSMRPIGLPGCDADDVLGEMAEWYLGVPEVEVVVVSGDKDLAQLLAKGARIRDHFGRGWRDADWVMAKFGVAPQQLGDYLALVGDTSDGIPGAPGVGPKTAAELLGKWGNLAGVAEHLQLVKGAVGDKLRAHWMDVMLSRELARLRKMGVPATEYALG